jgi:hypothetical protein
MSSLIKCTKCPFHLDAGGMAPGSVIQCPNCGTSVKVPSGQTGKVAAVKQITQGLKPVPPAQKPITRPAIPVAQVAEEPAAAPAQPARRGPGGATPIFRKASGGRGARGGERPGATAKKSNTPIIIGVVVVAVVAVGVAIVVMSGPSKASGPVRPPMKTGAELAAEKKPAADPPKEEKKPIVMVKNELDEADPNKVKEEEAKKEEEKKEEAAKPPPPGNSPGFELGAAERLPPNYRPNLDPKKVSELEDLIRRGYKPAVIEKFGDYFLPLCVKSLDDEEKVARWCMETLLDICHNKLKVNEDDGTPLKGPWEKFNKSEYRAGFIITVLEFHKKNREYFDILAAGKDPNNLQPEDTSQVSHFPWDKWIGALAHYSMTDKGPGYVEGTPEHGVLEKIKTLGKAAYPYLVRYVDNEDPNWAKGAVVALRHLTGYSTAMPKNQEEGKKLKADWMKNLGLKEEDLPR